MLTSTSRGMPSASTRRIMSGAMRSAVSQCGSACVAPAVGLRQRERGNAEDRALDGAGDRAGIGHVLGGVAAAVDARQHQIGRWPSRMWRDAHDDAVGRRALDGEAALADLAQPQRIVERQRMRDAGLVGTPAPPPRRRRTARARSRSQTSSPGAWMPSSLVTRMRMRVTVIAACSIVLRCRPCRAAARRAPRSSRRPAGSSPSRRSARGRPRRRSR